MSSATDGFLKSLQKISKADTITAEAVLPSWKSKKYKDIVLKLITNWETEWKTVDEIIKHNYIKKWVHILERIQYTW